ncbi:MAG: hypothetical protein D6711_14150 [Chloroflexi bacterium]|nr:MAG: hypothetical protein D6711_14150 [Chloroflexota bacterium]
MATATKFNAFAENVYEGVHNFGSDTLKVMLTNTAPVATNSVKADLTEITAGNGYTAGGETITITSSSQTGGTYTLVGNDVVFTASGGSIGPFRYVVIYNDTPTAPVDPLIQFYDYGSSITLNDGETFTVNFGASILSHS